MDGDAMAALVTDLLAYIDGPAYYDERERRLHSAALAAWDEAKKAAQ